MGESTHALRLKNDSNQSKSDTYRMKLLSTDRAPLPGCTHQTASRAQKAPPLLHPAAAPIPPPRAALGHGPLGVGVPCAWTVVVQS